MWCITDWANCGGLQKNPTGVILVSLQNNYRKGQVFCLKGGKI